MKKILGFLFLSTLLLDAHEATLKFDGRFVTDKLIYQPLFSSSLNADGSLSFQIAVSYLYKNFPAGYITSPDEEKRNKGIPLSADQEVNEENKPDSAEGKGATLEQSTDKLNKNHKIMMENINDLKGQMLANLNLAHDFLLRRSQTLEIPQSHKPLPVSKPQPETQYSYEKFINCLRGSYSDLTSLLYFQHFKNLKDSTKLEGLLMSALANEEGSHSSGMICGKFLGKAAFSVSSWAERAQIAQFFLMLSEQDNGENNLRNSLRTLIALKHKQSPVQNFDVWKFIWLRSSQLSWFTHRVSNMGPLELAKEFINFEKSDHYYNFREVKVKFDWKLEDVEKVIEKGLKYSQGIIP